MFVWAKQLKNEGMTFYSIFAAQDSLVGSDHHQTNNMMMRSCSKIEDVWYKVSFTILLNLTQD
jgi:hypothetical protein